MTTPFTDGLGLDPSKTFRPAPATLDVEAKEAGLTLSNITGVQIELNASAILAKHEALNLARQAVEVNSTETQSFAAHALTQVVKVTRAIEESRKIVKEPVLTLGKRIDTLAKEFVTELSSEEGRIKQMLSSYSESLQKMADEVHADSQDQRETLRKEIERLDDEIKKLDKSLAIKLRKTAKENQAQLLSEAAKERSALAREKENLIRSLHELDKPVEIARPSGLIDKKDWVIEITDIHALYAHNRNLVRLEPDMLRIKDRLKMGETLPGVKAEKKTKVTVRT